MCFKCASTVGWSGWLGIFRTFCESQRMPRNFKELEKSLGMLTNLKNVEKLSGIFSTLSSHFHCVGVCGPLQSVCWPRDMIYFLKAMTRHWDFPMCIFPKCTGLTSLFYTLWTFLRKLAPLTLCTDNEWLSLDALCIWNGPYFPWMSCNHIHVILGY